MSGLRPVQNNNNNYGIPQPQGSGSMPSSGGGLSELYNFDVFDMVRRKIWLILFFTLLGIAAALLFFFQAPKTYRSTAKVFVDEKSAPSISEEDGYAQDTVEKYIEILRSTATLKNAIRDGKFEQMETFEDVDSVIRYLRDGKALIAKSADVKSNSGVIKISFDGGNQKEAEQILDAVVKAFGSYIDSDAEEIGGQTTQLWKTLNENMLSRTKEVQEEIEKLMGLPEMLIVDGRVQNPYQLQQARLHEELHQLRRERTRLEARVTSIQQAKAMGKNPESLVIGVLQEFSETNMGAYTSTHNKYVELKMLEQELLQQYGSNHPELKNVRKQIAMVDSMRMQELSSLRGEENELQGKPDMVADFVERVAGQIAMISAQEKSLEESILDEQRKAAQTSVNIERLLALQRERDRLELYSDNTIDKLGEVEVLKDFKWRKMSELNPASVAEQVAPSLPLCLGGGLFLGTLLGFLFAGVKEMAEKTFRSSEDIAAILGSRVIGHVGLFQRVRPRKDSPFSNVAPELIALHQPSNQNCEAYRSIRTSIFFRAQETGAKIIQMTSPTPGDGKSTTIANLAASMAQSGRKVLLIDADLRKPRQHKYFGVDNDYGLTSVVYGQMEPEEAVRVIQPEYLSVVTCGPIPPNPSELLTSARFEAIIGVYREQYDYILIDTPPLLAVTDPAIVCRFVDLVYMVMRITNGVRSNSVRAKEVIDSMGVELSGVIINGLRRRDQKTYDYKGGKYGYGGYTYGGGYGSSYGKNYSGNAPTPAANTPSHQPPIPNLVDAKSSSKSRN
ncbi:Tyrosine-protein kinase YwqD [Mariniblastus fucicola]|uniref:non-specific protein-tyrosine kinase n=2 Tax=Mariniblastus fucicola TaxID=980251 RepID=A0A5B9PJZ8_9BACT|nr:Tyrosine-protein kinase YwqD [Mariniblastus fucicola]